MHTKLAVLCLALIVAAALAARPPKAKSVEEKVEKLLEKKTTASGKNERKVDNGSKSVNRNKAKMHVGNLAKLGVFLPVPIQTPDRKDKHGCHFTKGERFCEAEGKCKRRCVHRAQVRRSKGNKNEFPADPTPKSKGARGERQRRQQKPRAKPGREGLNPKTTEKKKEQKKHINKRSQRRKVLLETSADEAAMDELKAKQSEYCDQIKGDATIAQLKKTIPEAKLKEFCLKLKPMAQDTVFYHWTTFTNCIRWGLQGMIDAGEVAYLSSQHSGQAAGGGVYQSRNTESSRSYGVCAAYILQKAGTPYYDESLAQKMLGMTTDVIAKSQLGTSIPFIHLYNDANEWHVVHHPYLTRFVSVGPSLKPTQKISGASTVEKARTHYNVDDNRWLKSSMDLWKVLHYSEPAPTWWDSIQSALDQVPNAQNSQVLRDSIGYLTSVIPLLWGYYDGFSFLRAVRNIPQEPWAAFEPQHFGKYRDAFDYYYRIVAKKQQIGLVFQGKFGDGKLAKADWAKKMTKEFLPDLYKRLSGTDIRYREWEIRAGGDNKDQTFLSTPKQGIVMQNNAYLETYLQKDDSYKDGFLAYYYYPDPNHAMKLATSSNSFLQAPGCTGTDCKALETLVKNAKTTPMDKNSQEFKDATKKMMETLIMELFSRMHGQVVGWWSTENPFFGLALQLGLVGIHPCGDFNGRTTRFIGQIAAIEAANEKELFPIAFITDLDLVTDRVYYSKHVQKSSELYDRLFRVMIAKMLNVVFVEGRKAESKDYWDLPELQNLVDSLDPFIGAKTKNWATVSKDEETWNLIRVRDWNKILDKLNGGPNWSYSQQSNVDLNKH